MTGETFLHAMEHVDAVLIHEAETYAPAKQNRIHWKRWGGMAACLALVLAGALTVLPQRGAVAPPPDSIVESPAAVVDLQAVHVNMIDAFTDSTLLYYGPEQYDKVTWDQDNITAYYGWNLTPAYIPQGLKAGKGALTATVYYEKGGDIVNDTVGRGFYHAYYDDGSPMLTEGVAAVKGFSLTASKLGIRHCCYVLVEDKDMQPTTIGGTEVLIGYRAMEYGPYDPDTHEPSGTYDLYVAEFTLNGVHYYLESDQLPLNEVVKIVASIICDTADVSVIGEAS